MDWGKFFRLLLYVEDSLKKGRVFSGCLLVLGLRKNHGADVD